MKYWDQSNVYLRKFQCFCVAEEDIYEEVLESWNILKLLQGVNGNSRFRDHCLQVRMRGRFSLVLR